MVFLLSGHLLWSGCRSVPYEPGQPLVDAALAEELREQVARQYPLSFRTVHRGLLEAKGRQFLLDGYLLIRQPENFRLVAKGDMGGTAFELAKSPGEAVRIVQNPLGLRPVWLTKGAAHDVEVLYFKSPGSRARLTRRPEGTLALVQELPGGSQEEFLFQQDTHRLTGYMLASGKKCRYRVDFYYGSLATKGPESLRTIIIANHSIRYRLTLTVLELTETPGDYGK